MPSLTDIAHSVEEDADAAPDGVRWALEAGGAPITRDDDLVDHSSGHCRRA